MPWGVSLSDLREYQSWTGSWGLQSPLLYAWTWPEWIWCLEPSSQVYSMATWSGTLSALICAGAERSLGSLEGTLGLEKDSCFRGARGQLWAPRPDTQGGAKHFCSFSLLLPSSLSHRLFQPFSLWKPLPHALAWPSCDCTSPMGRLACGSVHCGLFILLPQE